MDTKQVKAKLPKGTPGAEEEARELEMEFAEWPESVDEAVEMWGEETAFRLLDGAAVIKAQDAMRRLIRAGKTEEQMAEELQNFNPGVSIRTGGDPRTALLRKMEGLSPEEKEALIAQIREQAGL